MSPVIKKHFPASIPGLALLSLLLPIAYAGAQQPLSLQESVQYAIQNSPLVQKAAMETRKGDYQIKEYLATGLPQLSGNANFTYNIELPTQLIPNFFEGKPDELVPIQFGTALSTSAGLELSQMVYDHTFWIGVKGAQKLAEFNRLMEGKTQEEIAYNVARIYFQAQILAKQRDILLANIDQVEGLLRVTELQFQNGFAKKLDVDQLRVNRSSLQTQLQNLDLQIEQTLRALKFAMAMPLDTPIVLTDTLSGGDGMPKPPADLNAQFGNKIDISILDKQNELLKLQYARTKSEYIPSARLFASYSWQGQGNDFTELGKGEQWFDYALVGLNIHVPIFDGFRKNYRLQQDNLSMLQNEKDRQQTLNSLEFQYNSAVQQLQSIWNTLASQQENRGLAEEVYDVTQKRYREGLASITEVLAAETAMREVQGNYLASLLHFKWAVLDLEYANGRLMQLINQ